MHLRDIDQIAALLQSAPKANPGDYASLEEFAAVLLAALAEKVRNETTEEELVRTIAGLVRRPAWYEHAVLRDLSIMERGGTVNTMLLRAWAMQAFAWNGYVPPYFSLLAITAHWLAVYENPDAKQGREVRYTIFLPKTVPQPEERPKPPPPRWMGFLLRGEPPQSKEELGAYIEQLNAIMGERTLHVRREYRDWYMACHHPELQGHYINLIGDMHKGETPEEWRELAQEHREINDVFEQELERFLSVIRRRVMDAAERAKSLGLSKSDWRIFEQMSETGRLKDEEKRTKDFLGKWKE